MKAYFFNSIKKAREKRADCKGGDKNGNAWNGTNMKNLMKGRY